MNCVQKSEKPQKNEFGLSENLPYLVDISDFSSLKNPDLIDHINCRGKVLYERTAK